MLIHAGGLMQTCPCASDIEIGDFLLDYMEKKEENPDVFNNESLQQVRKGLLTGNLRKMCRNCAFNSAELVTTEELKEKVINLLENNKDYNYTPGDDLSKLYAYDTIGVGLSNKCNLRCIYCNQSTCADTNPFYKMEFPYEYAGEALEYVVSKGVKTIITSVEGEITNYKHWYEVYSEFLRKHPDIRLTITTNLNREYSEDEIELLAKHAVLDVSCDSLNPEVYSKIRVNGKLELLLKNLERIKNKRLELGIEDTLVTIHVVVCNLTWESLEEVSEFAFSNGFGLNIGNYEERPNAKGYRENILQPISRMPEEIQRKVSDVLNKIKAKAIELGVYDKKFVCHGDIISRINKQVVKDYHRFKPVDNICYKNFYEENPKGNEGIHLDIVYDDNNIAYTGIYVTDGSVIRIDNLKDVKRIIVREVVVYKKGKTSPKYDQTVAPGFRKVVHIDDEQFVHKPVSLTEDQEGVMVVLEPLFS